MAKIEIRNVYKIFGERPKSVLPLVRDQGLGKDEVLERTGHMVGLHDVSIDIEESQTFVVMGLSGSGKSTLIRHINRLIDPTAGKIIVDGVDVLGLDGPGLTDFRRHKVSMVFQRFGLFPHRTVLDNVAYGLAVQHVDRTEREERARRWIDAVGLGGYTEKYPDALSGGMQQRVGLARALATDSEILLLDEPFSALDPLIRRDMQEQLIELQGELQKTIVFITHDLDEALRLGDRIAILKDGEIVQVGGAEDIILRPADDYVQDFVEDVNRGRVLAARTVMQAPPALARAEEPVSAALERMMACNADYCCVVDEAERPVGTITREAATDAGRGCGDAAVVQPTVPLDMVLDDCLPHAVGADGPVPVVDRRGRLRGMLSLDRLVAALSEGFRATPSPGGERVA